MENVLWDRLQFAFTVMFHYIFPIVTIGLAPFLAGLHLLAAYRKDETAARAARFWTRIFAINFAAGVVTGIPLEFQFGTNWAPFSARTGSIIGQPLAFESLFAFFAESVFLGALLYGQGRLSQRTHAVSAAVVAGASWLSGYFIVVTNAWMQHPVGYRISGKSIELTDIWAVLFSPFAIWAFLHVVTGAVIAGSFMVAAVGAFYLLSNREHDVGRLFVRAGVVTALVFSMLAVFPTGDRNGANVTEFQPVKLAAMEGIFRTEIGAPLAIIGMPDTEHQRLLDPVEVPALLSFLAYGNPNANVKGLADYDKSLWPPVALTYYAYHIMVGLGTIFAGVAALGVLLLWRKRLVRSAWYLWIVMLLAPFTIIANEAGWVVTEVGRQPWLVYDLVRTEHGASTNVVAGETIFTLLGFAGIYFVIGLLYLLLFLREIGNGPGASPQTNAPSATAGAATTA